MSDDYCPLPWSPQQWASLRAVVQESARNARVASSFLPLAGPVPREQTTVPALWMEEQKLDNRAQRGEARERLTTRDGKTLHLTTISTNVYLRGSEVADPELAAAKSMVRRAAEILGRLEDAIVFNGMSGDDRYPMRDEDEPVVGPVIYKVSGGRRKTGLLNAPDVLFNEQVRRWFREKKHEREATEDPQQQAAIDRAIGDMKDSVERARTAASEFRKAQAEFRKGGKDERAAKAKLLTKATKEIEPKLPGVSVELMCSALEAGQGKTPIVDAVIEAIQNLEGRGQFGPFNVVLGHRLFTDVTSPLEKSLVLPSDRITPFLNGGLLLRSSTLPADEGVVVAMAGAPVELVIGSDMDVRFLQVTLEPRYVLRVYERFALRVKQLDAICRLSETGCGWRPDRCKSQEYL